MRPNAAAPQQPSSVAPVDLHVQSWGIGVLDQLLWSELIEPEEAQEILEKAAHHENGAVREQVESIQSFLKARREDA